MMPSRFRCGHCGELLEVGEALLGQAVRCPHCQQVVAVPPAELPALAGPPPTDPPVEAAAPQPNSGPIAVTFATAAMLPTEVAPPVEEVEADRPPAVASPDAPDEPRSVPESTPSAVVAVEPPPASLELPPAGDVLTGIPALPPVGPAIPPAAAAGRPGGWFMGLVFIPLVTYALLTTVLVVLLYTRLQTASPSPLELLPDVEGDLRGASRQKQTSFTYERVPPENPLPQRLRVGLGGTLRVGAVEVTPTAVEWRRLRFLNPGFNAETSRTPALVLHLRLENVSEDVVFAPTDPAFDRRWKEGASSRSERPYTFLEVGDRRFYGGPLSWKPRSDGAPRETVEGQSHRRLGPGEVLETFLTTDPEEPVQQSVAGHRGPLLWRVHVRRGLVPVGRREVSSTAVVGVEFRPEEIRPAG
jgi:hypothetical protein